jgi:hypothetical protein
MGMLVDPEVETLKNENCNLEKRNCFIETVESAWVGEAPC